MRLSKEIRDAFAKMGRKGGKVRAGKLTPEQRIAAASHAARTRWAKREKVAS